MAGKKGRTGTGPGSRPTQFKPGNAYGQGRAREEIDDSPSAVPPDEHGRVPTRRQAFMVCAQLQCTTREIAAMVGVSEDTIERRLREDPEARATLENGRANGRTSIRRALYRQMNEGSTAAAIWLSKQFLGMREPVQEVEIRERVSEGIDAGLGAALDKLRARLTPEEYRRALEAIADSGPESGGTREAAADGRH